MCGMGLALDDRVSSALQLLGGVVRAINRGNSVQEILDLLYDELRAHVPYNRIAAAVCRNGRLSIVAVKSDGKVFLPRGYTAPIEGSSLEPLLREGRIRILDDLEAHLERRPQSDATRAILREGMRSSLTLPLLAEGRPVGVIFFSSREPRTYRAEHEELLQTIAGHVAFAVEKSLLTETLREKSEYLESILQSSTDAIIVEDEAGRIAMWSAGARQMYGYEAEEVLGRPVSMLVPPDCRAEAPDRSKCFETTRVTKDGRRITVNITSTGRSAVHRDVTHIRKLHELAALGELSATIAHEIKNPLAGISGAIQVLQDAIPETDRRRFVVSEILEQIRRLDNTVRDLLSFARPLAPERQEVVLADSLRRAWTLLNPRPGPFRFRILGEGTTVSADPHLLEQVWINLFQNAMEAMPSGGTLDVEVRPGTIEVRDSGLGIEPAHLAKIFTPFFSTKTRGTGLGLAISRRILEAHGWTIRIVSAPARGTSVFVEIPR